MYPSYLTKLVQTHKIKEKMEILTESVNFLDKQDLEEAHKCWDREFRELCTERRCCQIKFSLGINLLLK